MRHVDQAEFYERRQAQALVAESASTKCLHVACE
jgi:hypothetical protein